MEAAGLVLRSGLPGEPSAPRWAQDVTLAARRDEVRLLPRQARAAYSTALAVCLVQAGKTEQAADLADRESMELLRQAAGPASATTQSACYAALAEAYLLAGRVAEATDCARIARDYACQSDDDAVRLRALGMLAAGRSANGELAQAAALLNAAEEIRASRDWGVEKWPMVFATVLVSHRRGDDEGVEMALAALDADNSQDLVERVVAQTGLIWLHAVREEFRDMLVAAQRVTRGVDQHACPPFLLDQASFLECLALIQLGDPGAALRSIAGRQSSPGHAVCFDLQRATIHLQMQEPRKALHATEACVMDCPDHNLRTLPSVFLRRALAYELLGLSDAADSEFSRSAHLASELGSLSPALGLPMDVVERLYWRLMTNEPDFGKIVAARIPGSGSYPEPKPLSFVPPRLTDREAVLGGWLTTELTLNEIAERMNVSINTVKTQSRSLYRKLDAASRVEAARVLEEVGLTASGRPPLSF